ncbi:MAG: tRNA epoxyqueuosine(34) reductase QueG [SAR202 cluster bacterium Io17-Chloro-G2]|nr:MAG: tRNA epoxyqueuosine(34) reductase QueG [SAR202 cluster bacterium Io17-Chloro-G2]
MSQSTPDTTAIVKQCALEAGFDLVKITSADEFVGDRDAALDRIKSGLMDGLPWYTESRVLRGADPHQLLAGARSVISLGLSYYMTGNSDTKRSTATGKVARYAQGRDYHRVIKSRMRDYVRVLDSRLSTVLSAPISARWYVDDGPMLDRAAAARSGLGWFGKNTNILTPSHGSWIFLGQVITGLNLQPDPPLQKTCGSCVRCIDACPTGAIVAPYVIDNARCISHLTIENRGPIPLELRPLVGDWVFGCDICQDVCPVNRKARPANAPIPNLPLGAGLSDDDMELNLVELLELTDEGFQDRFRGSPVARAKRVGLQRNACVALGNRREVSAVPALLHALKMGEPLVRGHAAWALGEIGGDEASEGLISALSTEKDGYVKEEIQAAVERSEISLSDTSGIIAKCKGRVRL